MCSRGSCDRSAVAKWPSTPRGEGWKKNSGARRGAVAPSVRSAIFSGAGRARHACFLGALGADVAAVVFARLAVVVGVDAVDVIAGLVEQHERLLEQQNVGIAVGPLAFGDDE